MLLQASSKLASALLILLVYLSTTSKKLFVMQKKNTIGFIYTPIKSSSTIKLRDNSTVKILSINDLDVNELGTIPKPTKSSDL